MQRDVVKPPFPRTRKKGSLLPSVVVLPKINGDRNDEGDHKDVIQADFVAFDQLVSNGSYLKNKRVTKPVFQPVTSSKKNGLEAKSLTGE